jgi:hypothetical protein
MAITTITPSYPGNVHSATPYSAVFVLAGNDNADPGTLNSTQVLAGCMPGPLKEFLQRHADWTVLNLGGTLCGVVHCRTVGATGRDPQAIRLVWLTAGMKAAVDGGMVTAVVVTFEIRLSQSERT